MSMLIDTPGTLRPMLRLTTPVLAEQVLLLLVGFVDLWLTGNFLPGDAYVAAMTLMMYALWLIGNLFSFIAYGSTAMTARFVGAGDHRLADRVMNQSIASGAIWTAILMAVGLPAVAPFISMMGLSGTAAEAATQYLTIELCVLPAIMIERVGIACLRGAGDMVSGLVVMGLMNVINMVTSYALVVGLGPLPALGWTGIALGTAIGHVCGATIILTLLVCGRAGYHLRLRAMRPDLHTIRRILRIGVPGGIDTMLFTFCHMIFLRIILSLGDVAAAAHGVTIQVEAIGYMPGDAFGIAASTLVGQYLGARDPARAKRSAIMASAVAGAMMVAAGVVFFVWAVPLAGFFLGGPDSNVVPVAAQLLRITAFVTLPFAVSIVLTGALRGAGDTRWPLAINIASVMLVRIPLAILLAWDSWTLPLVGITIPGAGLGVAGAWYAAVTDITLRAVLLMLRFRHDAWQRIDV